MTQDQKKTSSLRNILGKVVAGGAAALTLAGFVSAARDMVDPRLVSQEDVKAALGLPKNMADTGVYRADWPTEDRPLLIRSGASEGTDITHTLNLPPDTGFVEHTALSQSVIEVVEKEGDDVTTYVSDMDGENMQINQHKEYLGGSIELEREVLKGKGLAGLVKTRLNVMGLKVSSETIDIADDGSFFKEVSEKLGAAGESVAGAYNNKVMTANEAAKLDERLVLGVDGQIVGLQQPELWDFIQNPAASWSDEGVVHLIKELERASLSQGPDGSIKREVISPYLLITVEAPASPGGTVQGLLRADGTADETGDLSSRVFSSELMMRGADGSFVSLSKAGGVTEVVLGQASANSQAKEIRFSHCAGQDSVKAHVVGGGENDPLLGAYLSVEQMEAVSLAIDEAVKKFDAYTLLSSDDLLLNKFYADKIDRVVADATEEDSFAGSLFADPSAVYPGDMRIDKEDPREGFTRLFGEKGGRHFWMEVSDARREGHPSEPASVELWVVNPETEERQVIHLEEGKLYVSSSLGEGASVSTNYPEKRLEAVKYAEKRPDAVVVAQNHEGFADYFRTNKMVLPPKQAAALAEKVSGLADNTMAAAAGAALKREDVTDTKTGDPKPMRYE